MKTIGEKFPEFSKEAVVSLEAGKEFKTLTNVDINGKWTVFFWWPLDFTFVCPTEIVSFNQHFEEFAKRGANLVGASIDSQFVHLAWRNNHPGLKDLKFPMLADTSKSLSEELGILEPTNKIAYRATFIIDPEGTIQHVSVNGLNVGRNVKEIIRILDALQTGELTPCDWVPGEATL
ncbi:MAG TPA: peroxiredoxin [Prolixibacteraceae bacterium]|jgi:peroxiredoxin (alkyl hydroperoxide reductase subunit C)|nr:peroxiredoxin [Prolixibacteraceae bacterium]HPR84977.1 peroxiredoxin [Prolixibacteraceae bacterium]